MSAAARSCHVTQPTLSAQIKRLELELGETLFGRTAIGLDPTPFADDLYRTLGPVLDKAADGLSVIRSTAGSVSKAQSAKARPAPLPNTRQLRYFVQTFEDGGMSRAASRLNVVQPAISMQIRALEKHFGGTLFERTRTGIYPTDLGRKAYAIYAPILDELKSAQRRHPRPAKRPGPMLRVGILPQPDWRSVEAFRALGRPRLFFGVSAGNLDSMLNRLTAQKKNRSEDQYSPGGNTGSRPDRATLVYANRCREAYPDVPIVLGGIEASLRRIAHYDYWSDNVRRPILLDAKADLLIFGMGERPVWEVARRLRLTAELDAATILASRTPPATAIGFSLLSAKLSLGERMEFLAHKLVPPPGFMRHRYRLAEHGVFGLALAYLYRPIWLIWWAPRGYVAWRRAKAAAARQTDDDRIPSQY